MLGASFAPCVDGAHLEKRRLGVVDLLIALSALVPWRTMLYVVLQLSIFVRTFDFYLKFALPLLFFAGIVLAHVRERRGLPRVAGRRRRVRVRSRHEGHRHAAAAHHAARAR